MPSGAHHQAAAGEKVAEDGVKIRDRIYRQFAFWFPPHTLVIYLGVSGPCNACVAFKSPLHNVADLAP